jgi:asparagine synthase (glutamine-hydrolysing)
MCGIVGFLSTGKASIPDIQVLRAMRESLVHRGPDDLGEYIRPIDEKGPFVFLGHRRLSIIDLAGGHQPLSNEDGTIWVIFNGEIYNFKDLRPDLESKGHRFRTNSDTEVIVHAYEELGENCFRKFNGMFAIALWDERRGRLVLARDRLGKKPLYYSSLGNTFLFGSELKAILTYPGFPRRLNRLSLMKYLFYEFIPCPHTIFEDARKLPPGSCLVREKGSVKIEEYWSPFLPDRSVDDLDEVSASNRVMDLLKQAVRKRLIADVPLGIFLSGGIDSSAIAALAQEEVPGKVETFSIGFEDPSFDESKYALMVSRHLGTNHHEQRMFPQDMLNIIPGLPEILDEPMADASILPTYLLSKFTRQHVTVALGGDGGDELFAGYPTYLAHRFANRYGFILNPLHPLLSFLGNLLPVSDDNISFDFKMKKFLSGIGHPEGTRNSLWLGSFAFEEIKKVLSPELAAVFSPRSLVEEILYHESQFAIRNSKSAIESRLTLVQYLDMKMYLQESILVKVDRASMANSLEVRAPFLDHELVEFVMGLPSEWKLKGLTSKYLLKKAVKSILPDEVIQRKKKGFGVPIAKWVKGPLKELFSDMLDRSRIRREGLLDADFVSSLLQTHLRNQRDNRKQLWTLLVWQLWSDRYKPTL